MSLSNPRNYKTQQGLLNALKRASKQPVTVSLASWYQNSQHTLVEVWLWDEKEAARYVAAFKSSESPYTASS